jgi:hypothetical protein
MVPFHKCKTDEISLDVNYYSELHMHINLRECKYEARNIKTEGLITLAFWMCSLDVCFTVACVFDVIFSVQNSKMTLKMHATVKRTSKTHVIDP